MTDLRQAAQAALEALEELDGLDTETECVTIDVAEEITTLREALAQPEQKPMHPEFRKMWEDYFDKCFRTQPEQEPSAWRDMVVVSLVREGINKHRARELADHFAAQPEQEPVAMDWQRGSVPLGDNSCSIVSQKTIPFEFRKPGAHMNEFTAPAAQPAQEPVAYYHPRSGFYWAKPTSIFAPTAVDVPPMPLYTTPPAAQRPWVGLTPEEVQFYALKHRQLVNAHYDAASDTNIITAAFEATVFYETVEQVLKERNE